MSAADTVLKTDESKWSLHGGEVTLCNPAMQRQVGRVRQQVRQQMPNRDLAYYEPQIYFVDDNIVNSHKPYHLCDLISPSQRPFHFTSPAPAAQSPSVDRLQTEYYDYGMPLSVGGAPVEGYGAGYYYRHPQLTYFYSYPQSGVGEYSDRYPSKKRGARHICPGQSFDEGDIKKKKRKKRRSCEHENCEKFAQGKTKLCVKHGGGNRCTREGCTKSAAGTTKFCISHGGGKRCTHQACTKSAIPPDNLCFAHGGGKRCGVLGCSKGARGVTRYCIAHGGGRRCQLYQCKKSDQGGGFCIAHGGGKKATKKRQG